MPSEVGRKSRTILFYPGPYIPIFHIHSPKRKTKALEGPIGINSTFHIVLQEDAITRIGIQLDDKGLDQVPFIDVVVDLTIAVDEL